MNLGHIIIIMCDGLSGSHFPDSQKIKEGFGEKIYVFLLYAHILINYSELLRELFPIYFEELYRKC